MKTLKRYEYCHKIALLLVFLMTFQINTRAQSIVMEMPVVFEISNTAINRIIAHQWSTLSESSWSDNYNGLNYSITLDRPSMILEPNKIVAQLSMAITSSVNGETVYNGTLSLSPELIIPGNTIELDNIITHYINLRSTIDQLTILIGINDSRLNQVIENILNPIDWVIYKGNAIEQSQVRWSNSADIRWGELPEISYTVDNGKIIISIIPKITSAKPYYVFGLDKSGSDYRIKIKSNNHVDILNVRLVPPLGTADYRVSYNSGEVTRLFDSSEELFVHTTPWITTIFNTVGSSWVIEIRMKRADFETTYHCQIDIVSNGTFWTSSSSTEAKWRKDD